MAAIFEGRNSLNFGPTRNSQTFLEFSDLQLSKTYEFKRYISIRQMSRAANVREVRQPRFRTYMSWLRTFEGRSSLNFGPNRNGQTCLEFLDLQLSKTYEFKGSISIRKMSRAANVRKPRQPRFWKYILNYTSLRRLS